MTAQPQPDRSKTRVITTAVVVIGLLLLLFAVLAGRGLQILASVVFLLAVIPLLMTARAQPTGVGRQYLGQQVRELVWFLVAIAVCAAGLVIYSAGS